MDNYESVDQPVRRPSARIELWDMLSILVLLATAGAAGFMAMIFLNPNLSINPLPPGNPYAPPTFTITPIQLVATWTATLTPFQTATDTPRPTFTPLSSPTNFSLVPPTKTPKPTSTPKAPFSAIVNALQSDITIPHLQALGCNWQGVGGSVLDTNNSDIIAIAVRIAGFYDGKSVDITTVSGTSPDFGRSGYEFKLGTVPLASNDQLYVQLLDQAGLPLSDNIYIDTFSDCNKNLVLVRFKKNR